MSPRVLDETEADLESDALDATMTETEEAEAQRKFAPTQNVGDLADGGQVNGASLSPSGSPQLTGRTMARMARSGLVPPKGRPAARRAWMWNGSESVLPLAWNPDGNINDGARRYLLKRYCLCCKAGGFKGRQCPSCVKNSCDVCQGSTNAVPQTLPNGKVNYGFIIPCFYLSKELVPFPMRFYGDIDCFMPDCIRRGSRGFKTEQDARIHGRTRHRMEYQVHQDALAASKSDEVAELRGMVNRLTESLLARNGESTVSKAQPFGGRAQPQARRPGRPAKKAVSAGQEKVTIQ